MRTTLKVDCVTITIQTLALDLLVRVYGYDMNNAGEYQYDEQWKVQEVPEREQSFVERQQTRFQDQLEVSG